MSSRELTDTSSGAEKWKISWKQCAGCPRAGLAPEGRARLDLGMTALEAGKGLQLAGGLDQITHRPNAEQVEGVEGARLCGDNSRTQCLKTNEVDSSPVDIFTSSQGPLPRRPHPPPWPGVWKVGGPVNRAENICSVPPGGTLVAPALIPVAMHVLQVWERRGSPVPRIGGAWLSVTRGEGRQET